MKRAIVGLVVVLVTACARPAPRVAEPNRIARAGTFEAETVDVTIDWDTTTPAASTIGTPAAIALTASDGSGLKLATVDARAVLYGPLAFTELHLVFDNPAPVMSEGSFSIALPETAAVSRFAMRIGDTWQEGEIVEQNAARATYEKYVHRQVDPALFTKDAGNVFRGRVYPLFPGQRKEIVLSWSEELVRDDQPYRLALHGLGRIEHVLVQLLVPSARKAFVLERRTWEADRDFLYQPPRGAPRAVRSGPLAITRPVEAPEEGAPDDARGEALAVLFQSSARTRRSYAESVARVEKIVAGLRPTSVQIACIDQEVVPVTSFAEAARRRPGGAQDLGAGLRWLAKTGAKRALVVSDGIATSGPHETSDLVALASAVRASGLERIDALPSAGGYDDASLHALTHAGLAREGAVLETSSSTPEATAAELLRRKPRRRGLEYVESAPADLVAEEAPRALVERAFAKQRIATLVRKRNLPGVNEPEKERLQQEIVTLSMAQRVLSPFTSMLVLETEHDYIRFKIPRDATKNVLVVGARGVELVPRGAIPAVVPRPPNLQFPPGDPNADTDGDGIPDADDKCPNEPETFNGFEDEDGCPDRGRVIVQSNEIIILRLIHFTMGGATVLPESKAMIDEIAAIMKTHPSFDLVAIDGHTDNVGSEAANRALSLARAQSVMAELVKRGVDKKRLVARGRGSTRPLDDNATDRGRAVNRRVEFRILAVDGQPTGVDELPSGWVPPPPSRENGRSPFATREKKEPTGAPLSGPFDEIDQHLAHGEGDLALDKAVAWIARAPDDLLASFSEGRALAAKGRHREAMRAFGSVLDLATKPDHRRAAAAFLESIGPQEPLALDLAIEVYRRVVGERPEQASSHRLLAHALAHAGRYDDALDATLSALRNDFDLARYPRAPEILREDASFFAAAASRNASRTKRDAIAARMNAAGIGIASRPSTTLALTWESDQSDLDLRIVDPKALWKVAAADVRTGFGPEVLTLGADAAPPRDARLEVHHVVRGPTGFAIGKVAIVRHDGAGNLVFEDRPFVVMNEGASVLLGALR